MSETHLRFNGRAELDEFIVMIHDTNLCTINAKDYLIQLIHDSSIMHKMNDEDIFNLHLDDHPDVS